MRSDGFHFEVGCGAGYWVAALKHHGFNIEGIEYAHELVDLVHSVHPQLPVRYRDALAIDRPDNHYDSYLSFGLVEHRFEGPKPFFAEAYIPSGQRGSGVEIALLVEDVDAIYQQAQAEIVREIADYPWHMRQFWVCHPDGYFIRPAQKILSVNPATYRRQVAHTFDRDTPRITQELLTVKQRDMLICIHPVIEFAVSIVCAVDDKARALYLL